MHGDVSLAATAWLDELWDPDTRLVWTVHRDHHMTRESVWYALGLLQRAEVGDTDRAFSTIDRVLDEQYPAAAGPHGGTFRRAPEEDDPPADPVMWLHYDPNWRQFIGTTLAFISDNYDVPSSLRDRVTDSISLCVASEAPDRVVPTYSNIALMKAWLECWAGEVERGEALARDVAEHFALHDAFLEFNSPTYYGIDLWALGLWRASDKALGELGPRIETALWHDIAAFYHADLRNMCGPFDRAYGMDMTRYAATLGLWIWAALGRDHAPFPDTSGKFGHPHDFAMGPLVSALEGPQIPDEVLKDFSAFGGERTVERTISRDPDRCATAWLGVHEMTGAQTGPASGIGWLQHHHATMHWRSGESVAWARLMPEVAADARASAGQLEIETSATSPITFEIGGVDAGTAEIRTERWTLTDRAVEIDTNAPDMSVRTERGRVFASYEPARDGLTRFVLRFEGR